MPVGQAIEPKDRQVLNKLMNEAQPKKEHEYFPYLRKCVSAWGVNLVSPAYPSQLGIENGGSRYAIALEAKRELKITSNCVVFLHGGSFIAGGATIGQAGKGYPVTDEESITLQPWSSIVVTFL